MAAVVSIEHLLDARRVWRGKTAPPATADGVPTGLTDLDAALPGGGWPSRALSEVLITADGVGELQLLWPALARLTQARDVVALVAPPYEPDAPAWRTAGVVLARLQVIRDDRKQALWAAEQCMRSGACSAVVCWPGLCDDRALRRLQVAAESGQCIGFAIRPVSAASNPSPAAVRIAIDAMSRQLRVLKCRGALPPTMPVPYAASMH